MIAANTHSITITQAAEAVIGSLPTLLADGYVPLLIRRCRFQVTSTLKDGYRAACEAHEDMEANTECGAYLFLTGHEYAHLSKQYMPAELPASQKREWQRGFVLGWNACIFSSQEDEKLPATPSRAADTAGWPLDM